MEEWKDIKGYEGLYQVSTLGRVRSLPRKNGRGQQLKGKYLKPLKHKDGYLMVILSKGGVRSHKLIHRLVAQAFIDNSCNYEIVNHKDEDKMNNQVSNLEFCTIKYNVNYGTRNQRAIDSRKKKVMCVETGEVFDSLKSVEEFTRVAGVSDVLRGKQKTSGGFHWRYA